MTAYRMLYLSFACIMLAGIWLTGFDKVHWLLYVPVAFAGFAGLSGFCINNYGSGKRWAFRSNTPANRRWPRAIKMSKPKDTIEYVQPGGRQGREIVRMARDDVRRDG